ncbi:AAA family ATPase [Candidatus Micrarchaeota archaeon]|nr:AAA family ATPase [Candidatus Micrarchaeota archaeon]
MVGRIIGFISGKGGVGKTTLTINLGASLASHFKKKVVILDCNLTTSHLGITLGIHHAPITINHVLRGEALLEDAIYAHNSGMHVIPASLRMQEMTGVDLIKTKPIAKVLAKTYDFVLLDCGPGVGREALASLNSSEEILFIATPTLPSVMDVLRYVEYLQNSDKKKLGLVLNMIQRGESQMSSSQVEKITNLPVISKIPRDSFIPQAQAAEVPAVLAFPESKAVKQIMNLSRHIAGLPVQQEIKVGPLESIREKAIYFFERIKNFPSLD